MVSIENYYNDIMTASKAGYYESTPYDTDEYWVFGRWNNGLPMTYAAVFKEGTNED